MDPRDASADPHNEEGGMEIQRKVRVHKMRSKAAAIAGESDFSHMDNRIARIMPAVADISLSHGAAASAVQSTAREVRMEQLRREQAHADDLLEMRNIFDMSMPHPVEDERPAGPWVQQLRPKPRRIVLSPYQYEMINYQRMLMRKNIWYYRDRMSVPRGPCPLHVLKDCWVQGIIDENTLMWGHGLYDWLPAKNIKLLLPMVRTPEVRLGAWIKRTFSLKPALERIRDRRKEQRNPELCTLQVDRMR